MDAKIESMKNISRIITEEASAGRFDYFKGRQKEISDLLNILSEGTKKNIIIVGEPGVGKTALVEGLALKISRKEIPINFRYDTIVEFSLTDLVSGTIYRGQFEEKTKSLISYLKANPNVILFIDEIHMIIGAGIAENSNIDVANIMKPFLSNGEITVIGATTNVEYEKYILKDKAFSRRFNKYELKEPDKAETITILTGYAKKKELKHNLIIPVDTLEEVYRLADKFIIDRKFPDKGIDLLREAITFTISENTVLENKQLMDVTVFINILDEEVKAIETDDRERLKQLVNKWREQKDKLNIFVLTKEQVRKAIAVKTGIKTIFPDDLKKTIIEAGNEFDKCIIGQKRATQAIVSALKRMVVELKNEKTPIASFLFLGPTGVGKTEVAKVLCKILFQSEKNIIRLDMSEYADKMSLSRIIGSTAGYIGYEDGGNLIKQIKKNPFSIVLFDEIEKAHPDIFNILLQILDEGYLTGSNNERAYFDNTIVILTSNFGAEYFDQYTDSIEFLKDYDTIYKKLVGELKTFMRPELLNRFNEIILFHPLSKQELRLIFDLIFMEYKQKLEVKNSIKVNISKEAKEYLIEEGEKQHFGARPLRRIIEEQIITPISDMIINNSIRDKIINVDLVNSGIICKVV